MVSERTWTSALSYIPFDESEARSIWKPDLHIENARDFQSEKIVDQGLSQQSILITYMFSYRGRLIG